MTPEQIFNNKAPWVMASLNKGTTMTPEQIFNNKAPWVMAALIAEPDFGFDMLDAAAICGNGGHESRGLQAINEDKPVVAGSLGGWSWFQWTGPRRRAFNAFCDKQKLDRSSDQAAYLFLVYELRNGEKGAVAKVKAAKGLNAKVKAFELGYERAHKDYKHYPQRNTWAKRAVEAYEASKPADRVAPWLRAGGLVKAPVSSLKPDKTTIRNVQQKLRDLGYPEVGNVDGIVGDKTEVAILAFKKNNGLPTTISIDNDFLTALMRGNKREVPVERALATAADLKDATSIKQATTLKQGGGAGVVAGLGAAVASAGVTLDDLPGHIGTARMAYAALGAAAPWLVVAAIGGVGIYFGARFIKEQVAAYRENRHT